jgi:AsmA protein
MRRRSVFILLIVIAVLLVVALAVPFLINANQFRPVIQSELTKSLGREVKIGDLKIGILSGTVTASDLTIADDPAFTSGSFLRAKALTLSVDLWQALFSRKVNVRGAVIDRPEIVLIQLPSGLWNFSSLGAQSSSAPPKAPGPSDAKFAMSVESLKITGAHLSLVQGSDKPKIFDSANLEIKDFAPGSVFPFSLSAKIAGGGDLALEGKAGPIDVANVASTPLTAALKITALNLAASGAVPPSSGIDGVVSADGTVNSTGQAVEVSGKLRAEKPKLASGGTAARSPLFFDVALTEDLRQHFGKLSRGDVAIGGVKASLTGTWRQQGEASVMDMTLSAPGVPVSGLVELLPAMDIVLPAGSSLEGGTAAAKLALSGVPSALTVSGPVSIRDTRLKGFNLAEKMSAIERLAGLTSGPITEIQLFRTDLRMTPNGTSLQDVHLVLPSMGELTGSGTISNSHALNFKMQASVRVASLVSSMAASNIPFFITGTSSNPQFRPDVRQLASEEISRRLQDAKVGGEAGKAATSILQGLFGGKKKK